MNDGLTSIIRTFQALGPLVKHAVKSGQVIKPSCELTEPDPDIMCEYDVEIPMSEGFSVTANVYRSISAAAKGEPVPVVMCAHPYNNHLTPALGNTPLGGYMKLRAWVEARPGKAGQEPPDDMGLFVAG